MSDGSEKFAGRLFLASGISLALIAAFGYGALAYRSDLPPIPQLKSVAETIGEVLFPSDAILETSDLRYDTPLEIRLPDALQPGLVLVSGDIGGRQNAVRIIDRSGRVIHEWLPVWNEIWPADQGSFPAGRRPVDGMILHGIDILPDASIVANFEHLSTFRMDVCGDIVWKLDNLGHHSVHLADDRTLWVSAENYIAEGPTGLPLHATPLRSWTLQNLDLDGNLLRDIPVIDLLLDADMAGLLYMSNLSNGNPVVRGDTLHLNDIDSYPADMPSDIFAPGDLLVSLRNINTVLVVDPDTRTIKFVSTGQVMRHHDPDFMPGDRISVFDNQTHTNSPQAGPPASRIVELDAATGQRRVVLDGLGMNGVDGAGPGDEPFFTEIMGVHQRLENGNILVVPSGEGRVLEFTPDGKLAWRHDNRHGPDLNRRIYNAIVLPTEMDEAFFDARRAACRP